jgi:hypothetical protein
MKKILFSLLISLLLGSDVSICLNAMDQKSNVDAKTQNILQIDQGKNSKGFKAWALANPKKFAAYLTAISAVAMAGGVITHRVAKKRWLWEDSKTKGKSYQDRIKALSEANKRSQVENLKLSKLFKEQQRKREKEDKENKEKRAAEIEAADKANEERQKLLTAQAQVNKEKAENLSKMVHEADVKAKSENKSLLKTTSTKQEEINSKQNELLKRLNSTYDIEEQSKIVQEMEAIN